MRKNIAAFALVAALMSTAACGSDTEPSQEETTSDWASEPDTTDTESLDRAEISRIAMEITFDSSSPQEQDQICLGITLYGREWSKQNLQSWVPPEDRYKTDWDASVDYLIERCAQR